MIVEDKISVIMPCYLGKYEGAASKRTEKLERAIKSFINQSYDNKELIIVADGCDRTAKIYSKYSKYHNIKLVSIEKQELFSGVVRNTGIAAATGRTIAYLDGDDYLSVSHLAVIMNEFNNNPEIEWAFFDDYYVVAPKKSILRPTNVFQYGHIGTSSIAHNKSVSVAWPDGYGHDFHFIKSLLKTTNKYKKIYGCGYYVCHIRDNYDF